MQISNPNNIKIYNLSAGKSLPEWLSDRKKRSLQKKDIDIRRRIELMQDFGMPNISNCVRVSPDGQYIYATGTYKPRIRCYDTAQLSMKFERCLDSEVVKFEILSDDYTKVVFLQNDRHVEFHSQGGRYFRTRIPKFGRDLSYHQASCDLYLVGVSPEVYRLNLEQGRFLKPLKTKASEINCCEINRLHNLFACGTSEGKVECWDPRDRHQAGVLDVGVSVVAEDNEITGVPAVVSLKYRDGLSFAVGCSTGHVLLYDIRSSKPLLVKDHNYGLPIKDVAFLDAGQDLVLSMDEKILKLWHRQTGKPFTSIEPGMGLNSLSVYPNSGLLFMANESEKVLTYYVPAMGQAPKWCSFLDNMTEELEETDLPTVYDDYKFITRKELEEFGLTHLIGTNLLRAYMHGYFVDIRLYNKAKSIANPFAYDEYRRQKIRQKIDEERANRVQVKKLPKVNKYLAEKLMENEENDDKKSKKAAASSLLKDSRFAKLFSDPDFEVDTESPEYRLLNPVVSKIEKSKQKKQEREKKLQSQFKEIEMESEEEGRPSDEDSSTDDEKGWVNEVRRQHKMLKSEEKSRRLAEAQEERLKPKMLELKSGEDYAGLHAAKKRKISKASLGDRVKKEQSSEVVRKTGSGSREMTFNLKKSENEIRRKQEARQHHQERRKIRRSAHDIMKKKMPPKFLKQ